MSYFREITDPYLRSYNQARFLLNLLGAKGKSDNLARKYAEGFERHEMQQVMIIFALFKEKGVEAVSKDVKEFAG